MSEPRVAALSVEEAKARAEEAGVPAVMGELNVFRVLLQHPTLAKAVTELLTMLLFRGKLDARLRELVIMRIGWVTGSVYEWTAHWDVSLRLGIDEKDLVAVRDWEKAPDFGPAERAVLRATDETLESGAISPETWAECEAQLGEREALLELVVAIGNWRLFSSLLRSLEIPIEPTMQPWPPDGKSPAA